MGETLIQSLIRLLILVAAVFIVLWVLSLIGVALPSVVVTIIWIIVALIAVLYLFRALGGAKLF